MLLAVDVGNTQSVFGLFEGEELRSRWRVLTERHRTADELAVLVEGLLRLEGLEREVLEGLALASVVPDLNREYQGMCRRYLACEALLVGPGVKTGMPILTNNPREVGADLIVDAVAAFETYGGPCIVVDFGTATTFGAVSEKGEYLGHAIAPGIRTAMDALVSQAAKLSGVELRDPGSVIGKTTVHSMQAGAVYGFAGQVDGIVTRMRAELGVEAVSVATGGLASLIAPHARCVDHLDDTLTLRGLEIVHRRNRQ
ncbi:MAG: type III pantothenate kinase [Thermoleophilia bacterium]|nr:type III pantothenate kinase [Thermoleophilia bacterium]